MTPLFPVSIGIDLVNVPRLRAVLSRTPAVAGRMLAKEELFALKKLSLKTKAETIAGIFAVKEAFIKAYGQKVGWEDIKLLKNKEGKPSLAMMSKKLLREIEWCECSISHDGSSAVAVVILSLKAKK